MPTFAIKAAVGPLLIALLLTACSRSSDETVAPAQQEPAAVSGPITIAAPPAARIEVVEDVYHGETVSDPYRWLENWNDPEVQAWSEAENAYARQVLARLPERPAVRARVEALIKAPARVVYEALRMAGPDTLLAIKTDPGKQQPMLVAMGADANTAGERMLVDPNEIDAMGSTTIDWYEPSWDGAMVAVSLSSGGSESGDVHVYDVSTAEQIDTVIPRVNAGTAGGDLAWFADDSGFFYTRYPAPGERPEGEALFYQQVWRHTLGMPVAEDEYVLGEYFPRVAEIRLRVDPTTDRLLAWVQDGDSNRFELYLRQPDGEWNRFAGYEDGAIEAVFGPDDALYVVSIKDAPRGRLLRVDASDPDLAKADLVVPESDAAMFHSFYYRHQPDLLVAGDRIYQVLQAGGPTELRVYSLDGDPLQGPEQMPVSTIQELIPAGGSDLYFSSRSYVSPTHWYRFDSDEATTTELDISWQSPVDYSDVTVVREFATSKDGTRVPVTILLPEGFRKDGTGAILVTGYGGYGISTQPGMSLSRHILFENGVAFAEANVRGGGEYGEEWHTQGNLIHKQNVFDDFAAVIQHLVDAGYASPDRVAITGGSNGGLLVGATMVQHPNLISAVVSHVGVYDMLRWEQDPNGQFNIPEFGSVEDPDQFRALYAYSPYHHVKDGVDYPPVLLATGANDLRVNPANSRKFAARLQAAEGHNGVVLLRTSAGTGHGAGSPLDEIVELYTDQYAFIFHYLDVPVGPPEQE
jgi:prolyl oligopeptidase